MKKTTLTIATLFFAGAANANLFLDGPNDRYSGLQDSRSAPTAVQPGVGDSYGGNLFEQSHLVGFSNSTESLEEGRGDAYASPIPNVESGDLSW